MEQNKEITIAECQVDTIKHIEMGVRNMQLIKNHDCEHMKDKNVRMFDCKNCSRSNDCDKMAREEANRRFYIAQNFYGRFDELRRY